MLVITEDKICCETIDLFMHVDNTKFSREFKWFLRPGSDAVLHMSRIKFIELSSCEVRRLNLFETADLIRIGSAVLHAWLSRE